MSNPARGSAQVGALGERGNFAEIGAVTRRTAPVGGND